MHYEMITIENGDVVFRTGDHDEAVRTLVSHVEQHLASRPGIKEELALIEIDDYDQRVGGFLLYDDLVPHTAEAVA